MSYLASSLLRRATRFLRPQLHIGPSGAYNTRLRLAYSGNVCVHWAIAIDGLL